MKHGSPRVTRGSFGSWLALLALVSAFSGLAAHGATANPRTTPPSIPFNRRPNEIRVHTMDVGQGQAVLFQTLDGKNILVDAGEDYAAERLVGYLKKIGVKKIDWLVISHRHMDHIGGVPELAREFPVENLVTPWSRGKVPRTAMVWLAPLRRDLHKDFGKDNRPKFHTAKTGRTFDFGGGAKGEVLWPPKPTGGLPIGDYNEESVVMRLSQKAPENNTAASFILGGDLGWQIERHLAKTVPQKLRADGLVGNHHGSKGSFERSYLEGVAGHTSSLLTEGPRSSSPISKLVRAVVDLSKKKNGKELASQVGLLLYTANNDQTGAIGPGESFAGEAVRHVQRKKLPRVHKLAREIAATLQKDIQAGHRFPWVTYSAGNDNPYQHPNSERMVLSTLLGCTMLGTDDHGYVVMNRKVDKDGNWVGGWQGHTMGNMGMPSVSHKIPYYKKKKDPKNPYDNIAREANYVFMVDHPDPTVSWKDKEQFLAPPGRTENTMFLMEARAARRGRTAFVRDFRALRADEGGEGSKKADSLSSKAKANPWHEANLDGLPWDQDGNCIWPADSAQRNSLLARARRSFTNGRRALRNAVLSSKLSALWVLGRRRGPSRNFGRATLRSTLGKLWRAPWITALEGRRRPQRQAQRNSALWQPAVRRKPLLLRSVRPRAPQIRAMGSR